MKARIESYNPINPVACLIFTHREWTCQFPLIGMYSEEGRNEAHPDYIKSNCRKPGTAQEKQDCKDLLESYKAYIKVIESYKTYIKVTES
jgi:hypothetical protein